MHPEIQRKGKGSQEVFGPVYEKMCQVCTEGLYNIIKSAVGKL